MYLVRRNNWNNYHSLPRLVDRMFEDFGRFPTNFEEDSGYHLTLSQKMVKIRWRTPSNCARHTPNRIIPISG